MNIYGTAFVAIHSFWIAMDVVRAVAKHEETSKIVGSVIGIGLRNAIVCWLAFNIT